MSDTVRIYGAAVEMPRTMAPAPSHKNRADKVWRLRVGFDNVYKLRIWEKPWLVAGVRIPGIHLGILALCLALSSCATKGDIKRIESWARHDAKMNALDSVATGERINLWGERVRDLMERVRYLEKVVAPNDPDGLLEDPDLYLDDSERKRFYRLWERTECGE